MALFRWHAQRNARFDQLARAIDGMAQGDLSVTIPRVPGRLGRIASSLSGLRDELVRRRADALALSTALAEMSRAHTAGDIDAVIAVETLASAQRSDAASVNALVTSHVDLQTRVAAVVKHYADGDFSAAIEPLPGKRAPITDAIESVKRSFEASALQTLEMARFNAALVHMTEQHALGWIDDNIPLDAFQGDFRRAADLINTLVRAHIDVKMQVVDVITHYARGDFTVAMDRLPGKKAQITAALDEVRALLPKPETIASMQRVQAALDTVKTNVMIADADNVICYMNTSVTRMMREAERDLQKDLPNFRADLLMSAKIDQFHKNPSHQTRLLADLRGTHCVEIVVGGRTMGLIANPIIDAAGKRIGAVVEWTDRTAEVAIERETTTLVEAAAKGDFTKRLSTEGREGFVKVLAQNINRLIETCDVGLNEVVRVLGALAQGDLTEKITNDYEGTFGRLKDDSNATVDSLTKTVLDIKEAADTVATSAREISSGNGDLSQRTEEQAASLEETAASMEQLTATVHQNSDNAKQANELAIGASAIALEGGRVVGEVVQTMAAINASAKKIVDIISVIDGIAFQTNILALNAAVEAARAGEQGRGFAVVAGEVRTLAQRSAAAAKEIKALIADSVDKTATGSKLVDEAGQTMSEVVASVKRVTDIMAAIASASVEQSSGIEQVNTAVTQMDSVTQQNAALVEQIAASAEGLEERAASLVALVSVFTLADRGNTVGYVPAAAPRPRADAPKPAHRKVSAPPAPRNGLAKAPPARHDDEAWSSF